MISTVANAPAYLPEAGCVDGLGVVGLAVVQVVAVEGASGDTYRLRYLVVLLQPVNNPRIQSRQLLITCNVPDLFFYCLKSILVLIATVRNFRVCVKQ